LGLRVGVGARVGARIWARATAICMRWGGAG
jgi:hypothetical protein